MNYFNLFFQILMIVVAIAIGVLYINPTIVSIKHTQDLTQIYSNEITKVATVNGLLQKHMDEINSVSVANQQALVRYVPDSVDSVAVMKDLQTIAIQVGVTLDMLSYKGAAKSAVYDDNNEDTSNDASDAAQDTLNPLSDLQAYDFELGALITYGQLKKLLSAIEKNSYLLRIASLDVKPTDAGLLSVTIDLEVYAVGTSTTTTTTTTTTTSNLIP